MCVVGRQLDTFSVEAWHKGGLLHAKRGHKKLPDWLDGHIVQAGVRTAPLAADAAARYCERSQACLKFRDPSWSQVCDSRGRSIRGTRVRVQRLGDTSTTAQVHPRKLTQAFVHKAAELAGTAVHTGTVQGLDVHSAEGGAREVRGVIVDGETIAADAVVVAMGPWSKQASDWLGRALSVSGQKYHSAVLRSDAHVRTLPHLPHTHHFAELLTVVPPPVMHECAGIGDL